MRELNNILESGGIPGLREEKVLIWTEAKRILGLSSSEIKDTDLDLARRIYVVVKRYNSFDRAFNTYNGEMQDCERDLKNKFNL